MERLSGKEEIYRLIVKVMHKFEIASDQKIIRNTNRENYVAVARELSLISNELPFTATTKEHQEYEKPDNSDLDLQYPYRKYDITGGQIKDVYMGLVKKPRPHLVDACYIYLYGVGRLGYDKNPSDHELNCPEDEQNITLEAKKWFTGNKFWLLLSVFVGLMFIFSFYVFITRYHNPKNLKWTWYEPTNEEIDHVTGIWLYQTGAPQTRSNEDNRFRRIANNILTIKNVNNTLELERYGTTINHKGYVEFTSPGVLSVHSYVERKEDGTLVNPSHSLAQLNSEDSLMYAISSTWSFESDGNNDIIGARNIYRKLGDDGYLREIKNTPENAACHCKIVEWIRADGTSEKFNLTYEKIQPNGAVEDLDESSLILRKPKPGVLLTE